MTATETVKVNERELVLDILLLVTRDGVHSHLATGQVLEKYQFLEKKSRAFISRLTQGTLERMIELDYVIDCYSKTPVKKMKPVIRCILRSGVYQLLYMDSVPASAACNEAVRLAGKRGFSGLKGFVNGVLRAISRAQSSGELIKKYPDEQADPEQYLSVCCSIPLWLVQQWIHTYDYATAKSICRSFLKERPTAIRVNMEKISVEALKTELKAGGVTVEAVPDCADALFISGYDHLGSLPAFVRGDFYVQDLSSMQVAYAAEVQPGWNVIDVCAAPGGKAIHVAQLLRGSGHVEARDLTEYKVDLILDNIDRCQVENMSAKVWDATVPDEDAVGKADLVIADLPCSGLGVLHSKPDIKYKMSPEQMRELAVLQRDILAVVADYVKPGGRLVYSTCTVNRAENEDNAAWFAKTHPEFEKKSDRQILPSDRQDGFYIAVFDRKTK
ncbi:MAG: 16S rRNA (cytosine(967)-C(5))-methyltransferase RsmB [Lachnospiraceae bacterium]|nr:16S rRNA (cytosine(967)-C(5))-methyltransferase RsmB [Lachnospiraceae bacterium]